MENCQVLEIIQQDDDEIGVEMDYLDREIAKEIRSNGFVVCIN